MIKFIFNELNIGESDNKYPVASVSDPELPVAFTGSFSISDITIGNQNIFNHNLGFAPVFMVFVDNLNINRNTAFTNKSQYWSSDFYVTTSGLFWGTNYVGISGLSGSATGRYYIFNRSVLEKYTSTSGDGSFMNIINIFKTPDRKSKILFSKDNKDISSDNPEDFHLNSGYRSLVVHLSDNKPKNGGFEWIIPHNLGYPPIYFFFFTGDGKWYSFVNGASFDSTVDNENLYIGMGGLYSGTAACIILKDSLR